MISNIRRGAVIDSLVRLGTGSRTNTQQKLDPTTMSRSIDAGSMASVFISDILFWVVWFSRCTLVELSETTESIVVGPLLGCLPVNDPSIPLLNRSEQEKVQVMLTDDDARVAEKKGGRIRNYFPGEHPLPKVWSIRRWRSMIPEPRWTWACLALCPYTASWCPCSAIFT